MSDQKIEPKCPHKPGTSPCKVCPDYQPVWSSWTQGEKKFTTYKCVKQLAAKWK